MKNFAIGSISLKILASLDKNGAQKRNFVADFEQNYVKNSVFNKEITCRRNSYCSCCSLISVYLNESEVQLGYGGSVSPQQKSPPFKDGLNVYFWRLVRTLIWCCTTRGLGMQSLDLGLSLSAGPSCAVLPSRAGIGLVVHGSP